MVAGGAAFGVWVEGLVLQSWRGDPTAVVVWAISGVVGSALVIGGFWGARR